MSPDEFANEVRIDIFLRLATYDPARGQAVTWVMWRVRKVFSKIQRRARKPRPIRLKLFSQMRREEWSGFRGAMAAVAPRNPLAEGGMIQLREDEAELRATVRAAVSGLPALQRRSIELVYGLDQSRASTVAELRARTGVSPQAIYDSAKLARKNLRASPLLQELAREIGVRPGGVAG